MKNKILIILALIIAISVLCCTVAVAEEISTDEPVIDDTVETPEDGTPDEYPVEDDETVEPSITDKIQEAGNEALSWFTGIAYALAGTGGVGLVSAVIALAVKGVKLYKALKNTSVDSAQLKSAFNSLADEFNEIKKSIEQIQGDTSTNLAVLLDKTKSADEKNAALCRTLATLINYSNLPDESKNNVLGEMNAALGYTKSEVTNNDENL